jgi:hypothetical protein
MFFYDGRGDRDFSDQLSYLQESTKGSADANLQRHLGTSAILPGKR